jgi:hypothetical protein
MMEGSVFLPLPEGLLITEVCQEGTGLLNGGQMVRLQLTVHTFFCINQECQRKIFTERVPTFQEAVLAGLSQSYSKG